MGEKVLKGKALKIVETAVREVLKEDPEVKDDPRFQKFIQEVKVCSGKSLKEHLGL